MRIFLVQPKLEHGFFDDIKLPPLGLAYLAAALRQERHDVRIFDGILSRDQFADIRDCMTDFRPEIVGISATSSLVGTAFRIAGLAKTMDPEPWTVLGGVHPSLFPEEVSREAAVDFVVQGEGETSMPALVEALAGGGSPDGLPGIACKSDGRIIANAPPPLVEDLDTLPFPAYDLLDIPSYYSLQIPAHPFASMITSRGCPYRCVFCSARTTMGGKYRCNSPERTVGEIRELVDRFGVKEVLFKDSEFTFDAGRVEAFCDLLLRERFRVRWTCNGRIGNAGPTLLEKMRASGCRCIEYGVESGDEEILRTLDKRITLDQIRETFAQTRKAGLKTIANFMIGNPGETRESVEKSLSLAREIRADYCDFSFATAFPGTRLYDMALENGWLLDNYDPANVRLDQCTMNATQMSTEELRQLLKKAFRSFYLRPGYILSRMATLRPFEWKMNALGLLRVAGIRRS